MKRKSPWEKRPWHRHCPPWRHKEHHHEEHCKDPECWEHGPPLPSWLKGKIARDEGYSRRKSLLFLGFALVFGFLGLLGCGVLAMLAAGAVFFFRHSPSDGPPPFKLILLLVGLALLLGFVLRLVGSLASRRWISPLSDTMKAADALAAGDPSARVPVRGSREFRRFARSFNRMAGALETANRQRRELLADVAHELRTPLTVIQGNLEGLRDGVYQATPEHLDLVLDETCKLSHLVDDLRLLTLAEAGQLPLDLQTLDVPQLLADVHDAFVCQADEAGIALAVDTGGPLPPLLADPQRLGQVLGNLVTNALRHTPPGGKITLGAAMAPDDDGTRLWVTDTGEGIPAEDLPRIFDRFWRGDPARTRETGSGSGLGLAIAKSLVEAHSGRIWAESQVDQGTTVSCLLPL